MLLIERIFSLCFMLYASKHIGLIASPQLSAGRATNSSTKWTLSQPGVAAFLPVYRSPALEKPAFH
jgi:hypothetical protein